MKLPGFVGGSNVLESTLMDCELSVNVFPQIRTGGHTKSVDGNLPDRPGLRFLFGTGTDPVSGMFYLDGRAFFVAGTNFCEQFINDTFVVRGSVNFDGIDQATMCSGGSASDSIMITAGSNGYVFTLSTNVLTQIIDADFPTGTAVMCEFFAGFFFVLIRNSRTIQWSALEDPTSWDPLDVFENSWTGDNIQAIVRVNTHIWLLGSQNLQVLYATGGVEVFAPAQESLIGMGCIARFSAVRTQTNDGTDTLMWLTQSNTGGGQVVMTSGLTPTTVSTYAIAREQQSQAPFLNHAIAFGCQMHGHMFYVLNNADDSLDKTPVYDASEGLWHHWAHWDPSAPFPSPKWFPFVGETHMFAFERHFIGDRRTGAVYEFSFDTFTDELAVV